uniref:Uncharacterized protein n=1 Tax=Latimeria chalumnae TaxID=7897 RepID=H2ZWD0_LATCH
MSVQVVAAKMAEVELKGLKEKTAAVLEIPNHPSDVAGGGSSSPSPVAAAGVVGKTGGRRRAECQPVPGGTTAAAAPAAAAVKLPQASAMKRSDPQRQQNGGEGIVSSDGTITEAPRTVKKVTEQNPAQRPPEK